MPIFEFYCAACKQTFEKLFKESAPECECPLCGKIAKRKVSAPAASGDPGCAAPGGSDFR